MCQDRIEALLERHRGGGPKPTLREIDDAYTDGCAAILSLENKRARIARQLAALEPDPGADPTAARGETAELTARGEELTSELARLRRLVAQLRTAVNSAEQPRAAGAPRRRFRRSA